MGYPDEEHCSIRSTGVLRLSSYAAAFLLLLSMSACGNSQPSSSPPPPPATDPADALLSGTYVFGVSGCINSIVLGGQFTADGQGNITAGSLRATLRPALSRQIQS
jgi:hypothetical protein